MGSSVQPNANMRIAPRAGYGYWFVDDWAVAKKGNDWATMIQIFQDRINFRYLKAIQELIEADYRQPTRRFGFSILALDCLLIETLAQFYDGFKNSEEARNELKLNNTQYYVRFLTQTSFVLKGFFDPASAELFYKTIRCGILHQAETKRRSKILLKKGDLPFEVTDQGKGITVYRLRFHELVEEEFSEYCTCLKNDNPIGYRGKFNTKMNYVCKLPGFEE